MHLGGDVDHPLMRSALPPPPDYFRRPGVGGLTLGEELTFDPQIGLTIDKLISSRCGLG